MCGIVGYIGKKKRCKEVVFEGLSRLEYRGYDSVGIAYIDSEHKHLSFSKAKGNISSLKKSFDLEGRNGCAGIGHTRWATHGQATEANAHPHLNCTNTIAVVHNGIIENHNKLRESLADTTHEFRSETDSEVAAHMLETIVQYHKNLQGAAVELVKKLTGIYALVFLLEQHPEKLLLIRNKSPLIVGIGDENDAMIVASDPIAFAGIAKKALFLPDKSFAIVQADSIDLYDFDGKPLRVQTQDLDIKFETANKQGFEHYMLKEIYEQKKSIDRTISFYTEDVFKQLGIDAREVKKLQSVHMVAAGTSWHAGKIAQFFFENICNIKTSVHLASEFRYKKFFPEENSIFIAISQSGETADTLECLRHINNHKIRTVALTNSASSTMVREANGFLVMQAGPEISVASTKAFTAQVASLYWLANKFALTRGIIDQEEMIKRKEELLIAAEILESSIENYKWEITNNLAPKYSQYDRFIFLGRNISYPLALEAGLKLKEISYKFAQSYPAGELKHGPIALIDEHTPTFVFSIPDELIYKKLLSNVEEIKARQGHVVAFAFEGQDELIKLADHAIVFPKVKTALTPIAMAGVMQFLIYKISTNLGLPIDKPRNLAKSVTVE